MGERRAMHQNVTFLATAETRRHHSAPCTFNDNRRVENVGLVSTIVLPHGVCGEEGAFLPGLTLNNSIKLSGSDLKQISIHRVPRKIYKFGLWCGLLRPDNLQGTSLLGFCSRCAQFAFMEDRISD